ncbi:ImmA/IrrE family metallo-endopeptidase [Facklamia hominis]|uniref:ImmA/IrrE family metallo-endopeptidase n=1 Tax=Facklamia hominis TaxID=178214 RepID=UPI0038FCC0D7
MLEKVKVGGIDYQVVLKDLDTRSDDQTGQQLGWCVVGDNLIEINSKAHETRQDQTLIHELTHAMFFEAGIEDDEDLVNRLGLILYQLLKDNDFSWLCRR